MKVHAFLLEFKGEGGILIPKDPHLHKLAVEFAENELAEKVNFTDFKNLWVSCEVDKYFNPTKVNGLLGMVLKVDFPLVRFTDNAACKKLVERASDNLADQGCRGHEVFVHIRDDEAPEQMCPDRDKWIKAFGMKKSNRYSFTIR